MSSSSSSTRRTKASAVAASSGLYVTTSRGSSSSGVGTGSGAGAGTSQHLQSLRAAAAAGGRERPGTASTIGSFASATGSVHTSSDMSGATYKVQHQQQPQQHRQQYSDSSVRAGKAFEALLASDETMVLSETMDLSRTSASGEEEALGARRMLSSKVPQRGHSEDDSAAAAAAASQQQQQQQQQHQRRPSSADNSSAPSSSFPTPTLDSTPRLTQRARIIANNSSSSPAPASPAGNTSASSIAAPPRPPRAVERSPSVSTRNSMASAQYATPPSGRSSTDSRTADSPVMALHPLGGGQALSPQSQTQALPPLSSPSSATAGGVSTRAGSNDQTVTSSESHRTLTKDVPPLPPTSRPRSRTSGAGSRVTAAELYAQTHTRPLPFPRSTSRPSSTKNGHTPSASAAAEAPPLPLPNDVLSLAQEVAMGSPDPNADKGAGTFFSQRIKKTSGFLKKLRGDGGKGGKAAPPLPGSSSSGSAGGGLGIAGTGAGTGKLSRRASQSSFTSEGGVSTRSTPNASSATSDYAAEFRAAAAEEPVPSIPSKWSKSSRSKVRKEAPVGLGKPSSASSSQQQGTAAKDRSGSAPSQGGKYNAEVPTRSSSQGMSESPPASRAGRSPTQTHIRKASATQGGSTSSGSDMRHTLRAWESEMDETLRQSAQDLSVKTRIAAPPKNWTPSPRLPDFDSLDRKQRSGSFMGDSEDGHGQHLQQQASSNGSIMQSTMDSTISALSTPSTPRAEQTQRSWSDSPHLHPGGPSFATTTTTRSGSAQGLGIGPSSSSTSDFSSLDSTRSSTGFRQRGVAAAGWQVDRTPPKGQANAASSSSGSGSGAQSMPSTPLEPRMGGHGSRADNVSARSDMSFETAVDPGSMFMRRADLQAAAASAGSAPTLRGGSAPSPLGVTTDVGVGVDAPLKRLDTAASSVDTDDALDPELSIRLLPRRGSAEAPPTPTDVTAPLPPQQRETMGHSREISDLGPLPGAGGGGPGLTAARRGSRASSVVSRTGKSAGSDVGSEAEESSAAAAAAEEKARDLMEKCWAEDETLIKKEKIAETLGGLGRIKKIARTLYMAKFDFTGMRVDVAFRKLCDKLFLRAETQQVDRILYAFSERFWQCNASTLYGSVDVVHSLVFSLLLLNTDLHVADIQDRMTRTQFVRNTLSAIVESRGAEGRISTSNVSPENSRSSFSVQMDSKDTEARAGSLGRRPSRSGSVSSTPGPASSSPNLASPQPADSPVLASSRFPPSAGAAAQTARDRAAKGSVGSAQASSGSLDGGSRAQNRAWEVELEGLLKEIYAAIKADQVRLPTADTEGRDGLSPILGGGTQRRMGGKSANSLTVGSDRINLLKRGSIRGIQGLLGSNTTLRSDENLSLTPSSFGSRSFSESWQQQTPNSSILSSPTSQLAPPTLGFASTLSQSIIKEAHDEDVAPSIRSLNDEIDDDELALMGPPWAKEGVLTRKHYWEAPSKRARDKNWLEAFVVVQKGQLSMFKFGDTSSSSSAAAPAGGSPAMGGGNWLTNATSLGDFSLAHTLANALPPPGYNRLRPHVFALTLSDGAVFFFQAGHEELVQEWVSTCNYWAARQSREPLAGGVSNMEYGWNRVLPASTYDNGSDDEVLADDVSIGVHSASATELSTTLDASIYTPATPARKGAAAADTRSIRSGRSGRSLRSRAAGGGSLFQSWNDAASLVAPPGGGGSGGSIYNGNSPAPSLRGLGGSSSALSVAGGSSSGKERAVYINDWRAPAAPGGVSVLKEEEQLESCTRHIARIEAELLEHNELQAPMLRLYSAKGPNRAKAMANWTRKSAWLLGELTKFNVYADCLRSAAKLRAEKSAARELASMIERADQEMGRSIPEEEGGPVKT